MRIAKLNTKFYELWNSREALVPYNNSTLKGNAFTLCTALGYDLNIYKKALTLLRCYKHKRDEDATYPSEHVVWTSIHRKLCNGNLCALVRGCACPVQYPDTDVLDWLLPSSASMPCTDTIECSIVVGIRNGYTLESMILILRKMKELLGKAIFKTRRFTDKRSMLLEVNAQGTLENLRANAVMRQDRERYWQQTTATATEYASTITYTGGDTYGGTGGGGGTYITGDVTQ